MKGRVLWESAHLRETWTGEVTVCVQQADSINVVFNCADLGEGQITLADTRDEQSVSSRFLYYGYQQATRVGVRGRFARDPDTKVFEGVWTDPIDGMGEWKFLLELEDIENRTPPAAAPANPGRIDGNATLAQLANALDQDCFTDWYPVATEPVRPGTYQVRLGGRGASLDVPSHAAWDGKAWSLATEAQGECAGRPRQGKPAYWRGLTAAGLRKFNSRS